MEERLRLHAISAAGETLDTLALLHVADAPYAALLFHPHPRMGGNVYDIVTSSIARRLQDGGMASTLRFNMVPLWGRSYREVADDANAALANAAVDLLSERMTQASAKTATCHVALVAYSFGSVVASNLFTRKEICAVALISPPLAIDEAAWRIPARFAAWHGPSLLLAAQHDQYAPNTVVSLRRSLPSMPDAPRPVVAIVPGVDHFYSYAAADSVSKTVASWLVALPRTPPAEVTWRAHTMLGPSHASLALFLVLLVVATMVRRAVRGAAGCAAHGDSSTQPGRFTCTTSHQHDCTLV